MCNLGIVRADRSKGLWRGIELPILFIAIKPMHFLDLAYEHLMYALYYFVGLYDWIEFI